MLAPIIPTDPITRAVTNVVWRMSLDETAQLENLFSLDPFSRLNKLMQLITAVARRDEVVRKLLAGPGVIPGLKKMALARQADQIAEASAAELEPTAQPK